MARQYHMEIHYEDLTIAEVYWHDNNDLEIISLPPIVTRDTAVSRLDLWQYLATYSRNNKVTSIESTKVP